MIKAAKLSTEASKLTAQHVQLIKDVVNESQNMNWLYKEYYYITQSATPLSELASTLGTQAANAVKAADSASKIAKTASETVDKAYSFSNLFMIRGIGFLGIGSILGVVMGEYFTYTFCEELLDKFFDYYKNNADKVVNSYKNSEYYFCRE